MVGALAPTDSRSVARAGIQTLSPQDVDALRLPGKVDARAARRLIEQHTGRSVWVPETLEYALIGSWRHRPEISSVEDLVAVRHLEPLLQCAVERCAAAGDDLLL